MWTRESRDGDTSFRSSLLRQSRLLEATEKNVRLSSSCHWAEVHTTSQPLLFQSASALASERCDDQFKVTRCVGFDGGGLVA
mgnify:CR=1 FL=1